MAGCRGSPPYGLLRRFYEVLVMFNLDSLTNRELARHVLSDPCTTELELELVERLAFSEEEIAMMDQALLDAGVEFDAGPQ